MLNELFSVNDRTHKSLFRYIQQNKLNPYMVIFISKTLHNIQFIVQNRIVDFHMVRQYKINWGFKKSILNEKYTYSNTNAIKMVEKNPELKTRYFSELIRIHNKMHFTVFNSNLVHNSDTDGACK